MIRSYLHPFDVQGPLESRVATLRKSYCAMRSVVTVALCMIFMGVVASACGRDDPDLTSTSVSTPTSTPVPTSTLTPTPAPSPSATHMPTETATPPPLQSDDFMPLDPVIGVGDVREALVRGSIFQLEVARTPSERARGLIERASLAEDAAMLFVYEREGYLSFWMKNTLISLDILFLNAKGVVVDVQTMHTQIGVPDGDLKLYRSAQLARFALEMNANLAEILEIVPGAQVLFR